MGEVRVEGRDPGIGQQGDQSGRVGEGGEYSIVDEQPVVVVRGRGPRGEADHTSLEHVAATGEVAPTRSVGDPEQAHVEPELGLEDQQRVGRSEPLDEP